MESTNEQTMQTQNLNEGLSVGEITFHPEFMAFCVGAQTEKTVEKAALSLWENSTIVQTSFQTTLDFLQDKGVPEFLLIDISGRQDPVSDVKKALDIVGVGTNVIAIGNQNEVSLYRDLTHIGLKDYLVKPLRESDLQKSIARIRENKIEEDKDKETVKEQITFIGTRGGVGSSTVAINMAWLLAEEMNYPTALIDLDVHYGTAALTLDLQPCSGLRDALNKPERLDHLLLSSAIIKATKNLSVLAMEESPEEEIRINPEAAALIADFTKENNNFTVIDLPRNLVQLYEPILSKSDHLMIVSDLSLAGIRDAVRLKKVAEKVSPKIKVHFLVNRNQDVHAQISQTDFERGVDGKVEFLIPDDPKPVGKAANAGCAISKLESSAKSAQALRKICEKISSGKNKAKEEKKGLLAKLFKGDK